jgi:hypothetical protein
VGANEEANEGITEETEECGWTTKGKESDGRRMVR